MRRLENLHILVWLFKDIAWMLGIHWLGVVMVPIALVVALYIVFLSHKSEEVWVQLAVLFWIMANSIWMLFEFWKMDYKWISLPFFILGIVSFSIFAVKTKFKFI